MAFYSAASTRHRTLAQVTGCAAAASADRRTQQHHPMLSPPPAHRIPQPSFSSREKRCASCCLRPSRPQLTRYALIGLLLLASVFVAVQWLHAYDEDNVLAWGLGNQLHKLSDRTGIHFFSAAADSDLDAATTESLRWRPRQQTAADGIQWRSCTCADGCAAEVTAVNDNTAATDAAPPLALSRGVARLYSEQESELLRAGIPVDHRAPPPAGTVFSSESAPTLDERSSRDGGSGGAWSHIYLHTPNEPTRRVLFYAARYEPTLRAVQILAMQYDYPSHQHYDIHDGLFMWTWADPSITRSLVEGLSCSSSLMPLGQTRRATWNVTRFVMTASCPLPELQNVTATELIDGHPLRRRISITLTHPDFRLTSSGDSPEGQLTIHLCPYEPLPHVAVTHCGQPQRARVSPNLQHFIAHHAMLGVHRFFLLDRESIYKEYVREYNRQRSAMSDDSSPLLIHVPFPVADLSDTFPPNPDQVVAAQYCRWLTMDSTDWIATNDPDEYLLLAPKPPSSMPLLPIRPARPSECLVVREREDMELVRFGVTLGNATRQEPRHFTMRTSIRILHPSSTGDARPCRSTLGDFLSHHDMPLLLHDRPRLNKSNLLRNGVLQASVRVWMHLTLGDVAGDADGSLNRMRPLSERFPYYFDDDPFHPHRSRAVLYLPKHFYRPHAPFHVWHHSLDIPEANDRQAIRDRTVIRWAHFVHNTRLRLMKHQVNGFDPPPLRQVKDHLLERTQEMLATWIRREITTTPQAPAQWTEDEIRRWNETFMRPFPSSSVDHAFLLPLLKQHRQLSQPPNDAEVRRRLEELPRLPCSCTSSTTRNGCSLLPRCRDGGEGAQLTLSDADGIILPEQDESAAASLTPIRRIARDVVPGRLVVLYDPLVSPTSTLVSDPLVFTAGAVLFTPPSLRQSASKAITAEKFQAAVKTLPIHRPISVVPTYPVQLFLQPPHLSDCAFFLQRLPRLLRILLDSPPQSEIIASPGLAQAIVDFFLRTTQGEPYELLKGEYQAGWRNWRQNVPTWAKPSSARVRGWRKVEWIHAAAMYHLLEEQPATETPSAAAGAAVTSAFPLDFSATTASFLHQTLSRSLHPRLRTTLLFISPFAAAAAAPVAAPAAVLAAEGILPSLSRLPSVPAGARLLMSSNNNHMPSFNISTKHRLFSAMTTYFGGEGVPMPEMSFESRWMKFQSAIAVAWVQEEWDLQALAATELVQPSSFTVPESSSLPESLPSRAYDLLFCSRDVVIVELLRPEWTMALQRRGYSTSSDGVPPAAASGRPLTIVERLSRDAGMAYASIEIQPMEPGEVESRITPEDIEQALLRLKQQLQRRANFSARTMFPHVLPLDRKEVWNDDD